MGLKISCLLIIFSMTACSNKQKSNPPISSEFSHTPKSLSARDREGERYHPNIIVEGSGESTLAAAVLLGAISGAFFSKNANLSELTGTCHYGDPELPAISSPCVHSKVQLLDDQGQIAATSNCNENGEFRFSIPTGQSYFVKVLDQKGRSSMIDKKFGGQSRVSIFLKP